MEPVVSGSSPFGDVGRDPQAFERFWNACADACRRFLHRQFASYRGGCMVPKDFDDMVEAEVDLSFCIAKAQWDRYDAKRASAQTWVNTIARYRMGRSLEQQVRMRRYETALQEGAGAWKSDPAEAVVLHEAVQGTLGRIHARQARVLCLHHLEDRSLEDVARRLETTPVAVQSMAQRGRTAFRALWGMP